MDDLDWNRLSAHLPILAAVPENLRAAASRRGFDAGEILFRQGVRPAAMFCVLAGEVRLLRRDADGSEIVLQRSRGGFFAEASLESPAYHCEAVAAAAGELLRFPITDFRSSLATDAVFNRRWIAHLAGEVRRLRAQCERLGLRGAAERVIHYIETEGRDGRLDLAQSRKAWASELGLSHEALYRTLSRLSATDVLAMEGDALVLLRRG